MAETPTDLIHLKYGLKDHSDKYTLIEDIVKFILAKFPSNISDLKLNPQLTKLICDIIEDRLPNNNKKIDKLDLLLKVLQRIFVESVMTPGDLDVIKQQVVFFIDNNKIKGIRIVRKVGTGIVQWVFRKFL
jgi:hypothetical protein